MMKYSELLIPDCALERDDTLDRMRRNDPIFRFEGDYMQGWFLTRYDDVFSLLKDDRFIASGVRATIAGRPVKEREELRDFSDLLQNMFSQLPEARHKKLQSILLQYFTPKIIAGLQSNFVIQGHTQVHSAP